MPRPPAPLEGLSVVLLGNFNPPIFQPAWFGEQGLLARSDAKSANILTIQSEIAAFRTEDLQVVITREQFAATTTSEYFHETLRDIVIGTFRLLSHTPVSAIGINHDIHFNTPSEDTWLAIGKRLAPTDQWEGALDEPRLATLTIRGARTDGRAGSLNVKVEPSARIPHGLYVQVNDHFERPRDESHDASIALDVLSKEWEAALQRAGRTLDHVGAMIQ